MPQSSSQAGFSQFHGGKYRKWVMRKAEGDAGGLPEENPFEMSIPRKGNSYVRLFGRGEARLQKLQKLYNVELDLQQDKSDDNAPWVLRWRPVADVSVDEFEALCSGDRSAPLGKLLISLEEEFHIVEESLPIQRSGLNFLRAHMQIIKDIARVIPDVRINLPDLKDLPPRESGSEKPGESSEESAKKPVVPETPSSSILYVEVSGPKPAVELAKQALKLHFRYFPMHEEIAFQKKELDEAQRKHQRTRRGA